VSSYTISLTFELVGYLSSRQISRPMGRGHQTASCLDEDYSDQFNNDQQLPVCFWHHKCFSTVGWVTERTSIRPLSGISSFSNDTVRFTRLLVCNGNRKSHFFFGELKYDKWSLVFLCITRKPKKTTLIFTDIVFTISRKTYSHRCQCNAPKLLPDHNGTVSLNGRINRYNNFRASATARAPGNLLEFCKSSWKNFLTHRYFYHCICGGSAGA